jgi:hypothetical protein
MKFFGDLFMVLLVPLLCMLVAAFVALVLATPNGMMELLG